MAPTGPHTVTGHVAALARDAAVGFVRRYHRLAVTVDAPLPPGPALLVAAFGPACVRVQVCVGVATRDGVGIVPVRCRRPASADPVLVTQGRDPFPTSLTLPGGLP